MGSLMSIDILIAFMATWSFVGLWFLRSDVSRLNKRVIELEEKSKQRIQRVKRGK